ncbi:hypothetical protein GCM10029976_050520 [Kribbella albertanoniae]|uniref:Fibronectin type III domain-containing protein n=1 Tax=Kribbella albertanoniae TaxID=1266829 RepID=A0A4R4Q4W1_9ACTN|nr:hypothetical protein [Kribbella albertanoniae]TDC30128.1 hypothetical protein E1261_14185 [Kribbella albertanoniae]
MRKIALAVTAVAALSVGLQTPAFAVAPDAPTDLTVAWVDGKVHLTWKDNGDANLVYAEYDGGTPGLIASLTAAGGNEISLTNPLTASDKVRLIVKASNGTEVSEGTATPVFDTRRPAVPALKDANLVAVSTASISWTLAAVADQTPGDPLDVAGAGAVKANIDLPGTATNSHTFAVGATSGVLPAVARPAAIKLSAVNEWGDSAQDVKVLRVGSLAAGMTVPARAVYGSRLAIKSTLDLFTSEGREERASGIKVELQARAKTTDAWKTYGRYAGNTTAAFETGIASLGNRQYRLLVPARKIVATNVIALTPATSTSAKSSVTLTKFISAGFTPAVANRGANVDLSARISPASTVKARLQFWDGQAWFDAGPLQFNNGYALQHGGAGDEPGSARFRITVPAVLVNGLTVSATTSSAFTLTIR